VLVLEWQLDRLKGKGLLQDVDLTSGVISVHDLYIEFVELELQGKLDESTDLKDRRWVKIGDGDQLTELERTPSGGCWQNLVRLGIHQDVNSRPPNPIESLEGIEWQFFSNVVVLDLTNLDLVQGTLNLKVLKCLRSLCLDNIGGLNRVEGLEGLKNLSYFKWHHWHDTAGGDMQFPASLRVLQLEVPIWLGVDALALCKNLRKLQLQWIRADNLDLSNCSSLQSVTLDLAHVRKLQILLGGITGRCASSLQSLKVSRCSNLVDIPGLDQQIGLERLVLRNHSIKEMPDLQNLTKLQVLKLMGARREPEGPRQLRESQLEGLPALRRLAFEWCKISPRLPDLSKSRNLEKLTLLACEMELCEEDIRMLASLPLLQPVKVKSSMGGCFKLDLARRKMLKQGSLGIGWVESDLGIPPIKIGNSDEEDDVEESDEEDEVDLQSLTLESR
jgi:hypothetical protein